MEVNFRTEKHEDGLCISIVAVFNEETGFLSFHKRREGADMSAEPLHDFKFVVDGEQVEIVNGRLRALNTDVFYPHEPSHLSETYYKDKRIRMGYGSRLVFNTDEEISNYIKEHEKVVLN